MEDGVLQRRTVGERRHKGYGVCIAGILSSMAVQRDVGRICREKQTVLAALDPDVVGRVPQRDTSEARGEEDESIELGG